MSTLRCTSALSRGLLACMLMVATDPVAYGFEGAALERGLTLPPGVSLGGYGNLSRRFVVPDLRNKFPFATWFRPSEGTRDPIRAKVFLLRAADDARLLFVGLDVVASSAGFRRDLAEALRPVGFDEEDIHVFATHTHSGPAGISDNGFWQVTATDRYQPQLYDSLVSQTVTLARDAAGALEPVELFAYSVETSGLQRNRRRHGAPVDARARLVVARRKTKHGSYGSYVGGFLNYALHGTALRPQNLELSADAPGVLTDAVSAFLWEKGDKRGPRPAILFLAGSLGDVVPSSQGPEGLVTAGREFRAQLEKGFERGRRLEPRWTVTSRDVPLGEPLISSRNCLLGTEFEFLGRLIPRLPVASFFPRRTTVWNIDLGGVPLALWPGEPTSRLGAELGAELGQNQKEAKKVREKPWLVSLANDCLAYFTTPDEYAEGGYETCLNLYGAQGGRRILDGLHALTSGR